MPTRHRRDAEKYKMAGWTWFPFDVVDWLTSDDVARMNPHDRGVYITLLCIQWRDGFIPADNLLAAKALGIERRNFTSWMQRWSHLVPCMQHPYRYGASCVQEGCKRLANVKLRKIAVEVGNPKAGAGTEESKVEKSTENKNITNSTNLLTRENLESEEQPLYGLSSGEQDEVKSLAYTLRPHDLPDAETLSQCRSLMDEAGGNLKKITALLEWNRAHETGRFHIRTAKQFLKALNTGTILNNYDAHSFDTCKICRRLNMRHFDIAAEIERNRETDARR